MSLSLDKTGTALVVIDLQKGIAAAGRTFAPHSAVDVIRRASQLADAFRGARWPVCLVHVAAAPEERLHPEADDPGGRPTGPPAPDASEFVPEIGPLPGDLVITKRQWGAFYGTDLELQLRRREVRTIVLCGIATNYGVESTARFAYELGFAQVFAEDAMTSMSADLHRMSVEAVLKRIGRVRSTAEILDTIRPLPAGRSGNGSPTGPGVRSRSGSP